MTDSDKIDGWFVVELMGHRKLGGFVREQTIAGSGFLRIDVPATARHEAVTQFFRPESVYALTPTTEQIARGLAETCRPEPVHAFQLPKPRIEPVGGPDDEDDDEDRDRSYYDDERDR